MGIDDDKSSIEPLEQPEFRGMIPEHMLAKLADKERYLFERVSEMEQRESWLVQSCRDNRRHLINTDTVARSVHRWRQQITSRWGFIVGAVVIALPVVLKAVVEIWLRK